MKKGLGKSGRGIAFLMAVLMAVSLPAGVLAANPIVTEVKDDGKDLDYTITEEASEDGSTADVRLEVIEKNGNSLTEITMPDGTVVYPEAKDGQDGFRRLEDGVEKNVVHYQAVENGMVNFKLKYTVPVTEPEVGEPVQDTQEQPENQEDFQSEPSEEPQTEFQSEPAREPEPQTELEPHTEPEPDTTEGESLLSKVVDTLFPAIEVQAAGSEETAEERVMEISYEVTGIVPLEETEETKTEEPEKETAKDDSLNLLDDVATDATGSISISDNNTAITQPSEFVIGDPEQEYINLTVRYSPSNVNTGRKVKITIPEGFTLVKVPSASDLVSASEIKQTGNVLDITFHDNMNITATFDIQIRQNKQMLYQNASEGAKDYEFLLEGFAEVTTPVLSEKMVFQIDELADPAYQIEMNPDLTFGDLKLPYNSGAYTEAVYNLKITKPEKTKRQEDFGIYVPKSIKNSQYHLDIYGTFTEAITVNGTPYRYNNFSSNFSVSEEGDYYVIRPSSESMKELLQNTYLDDSVIECKCTYSEGSFSAPDQKVFLNEKYESPVNLCVKSSGADIYTTKLTLDTTTDLQRSFSSTSSQANLIQMAGTDVTNKISVKMSPEQCNLRDAEVLLQIPEEFQVKGITAANIVEIKTSKDNIITESDISGLGDDEYITSIKVKGNIWHHSSLDIGLDIRVRETYPDGSTVASPTTARITGTISSTENNVQTTNINLPFKITNKVNDNLKVENRDKSYTVSVCGSKNVQLTSYLLSADYAELDTQIYRNAELEIEGNEILSLTDGIGFFGGDAAEMEKIKIKYTTRLDASEKTASPIKEDSNYYARFSLDEGDYITGLKICSDELDLAKSSSNYYVQIYLISSRVPKTLPLDATSLDGKNYDTVITFTADNTNMIREYTNKSSTFKEPVDADILTVDDMSATQVNIGTGIELAGIHLDKINDDGRIVYENPVIDFTGTDPELLSMITGVKMKDDDTGFTQPLHFNWYFTTNKRTNVQVAYATPFRLSNDEYITDLKMVWDYGSSGSFNPLKNATIIFVGTPSAYSKITGQYIGDSYQSYPVKASFEADNKAKYEREGKSVSISGKTKVTATSMSASEKISAAKIYQGNSFDVSVTPTITLTNPAYSNFDVKNPVFYIEVDSRYSFEADSVKTDIGTAKTTWEQGKLANGNGVLKIELTDYEEKGSGRSISFPMEFKLRVKPSANPEKGVQPVVSLWADLSETTTLQQPEGYADVVLENTVKDTLGLQDDTDKEFYSVQTSVSGGQEILPISEMGISSLGIENASYGEEVEGHDNEAYGQQISIISNYDMPTKDWILYIPIPKEGKSVYYRDVESGMANVGKTPAAGIGMNLTKAVEISNAPAGTKISYSTDSDPAYALDGSSVGNYTESVSDWSKVTMVKIEIPELAPKEHLYPVLSYESDTKVKLYDLICYGGVYYNTKVGDSPDYFYGTDGNYAKNNTYTIIDYQVTGHVWEEMAVPSDHILTDTDQAKAGVTVSTAGKDGAELKAVTDANGDYILTIPSHGGYDILIHMPDNDHTKPKERYSLVDADQGTKSNSSKFDPGTKTASVTLNNEDIANVNAGLWAERTAFVEPDDIYMAKGTTEPVPVYSFPSYVKVTFGQAADTSIASVSSDGIITAIETGVTKAEVSIPDGRGGIITDTYNIHVIPQKPTAVPETVHIFEGGSFDPRTGVTVTDGDGNVIPVDDPSITIENPVDTAMPGKYIVTYTITDEWNRVVKAYRSIYVHRKIQIVKPDDWLTKTGTMVDSLDGVSASYGQVQENGSVKTVEVPVTAVPADSFTRDTPGKQKVELSAKVTYEGASNAASDSYTVTFNDKPVITAPDEIYVKPGSTDQEIAEAINGTASMETAGGTNDLTDGLMYQKDPAFDTSVPNSTGKVTLKVTDPDTGEVVTKEVTVHTTGNAAVTAGDLDVVVGQAYDPSADVTITDGMGNIVTLTPDMIIKDNVPVDTDGKFTDIGEYEVTYHYTDSYGNEAEAKRTVKVNGRLVLETPDKHLRQMAGGSYTPDSASAYYINSKNVKTEVTGGTYDKAGIDLTNIGTAAVTYQAVHPVSNEASSQGYTVYIHGNPVIMAEGDTIYTHHSTGPDVLEDVVKNGTGNGHKTPASAYVEYVQADGSIQKVDLTALIQYQVSDSYTPETVGTYPVTLTVSDALYVLAGAPGLAAAEGSKAVDVSVVKKTYTVTFAVEPGERGGGLDGNTAPQTVAYGEYPTRGAGVKVNEGSAFLGWSFSYTPEGGTEPVSGTIFDYTRIPITADVTFTAQFAKIPFVSGISTGGYIKVQKGTDAPADAGTDTITKIEYETSEPLPAEAWFKFKGVEHYHIAAITFTDLADREHTVDLESKTAQEFIVGDTMDETAKIEITVNKEDGTLHITGIEDSLRFTFTFAEDTKYTVAFKEELDSTTNWGENTGLYTGDPMGKAPAENPVKPGYTFGGWSSDGSNTPDQMYDPVALMTDKNEVYYAVWIPKEYTVHYNTGGGSAVPDRTGVHFTDQNLLPADAPTKDGYTFAGWEKDAAPVDSNTPYNALVADDTVSEITLFAKWEVKHFTAFWKTEDEETLGSINGGNQQEDGIAYNGYATTDVTAKPASGNAEFIGWEYSYIPDGSQEAATGFTTDYKTIPVLGEITFVAKFAEKPFLSIGATNGKVTAAKGSTPEEIGESTGTYAMVQYTAAEDIVHNPATAALKMAADMHHHLTVVTMKDTVGHEYSLWAKDGNRGITEADYEVGGNSPATKVHVKFDDTTGTILVSNIDTSLEFYATFEEDPKYKVEFFREKDDPDSLMQTNDGLYTNTPVGDKPETDPEKPGYTFLGWSMDGTNTPEKMYSKDTLINDADVAYYGVWELVDYQLDISNTVAGEFGNKDHAFHFTITLKDADGKPLSGTYDYTGAAIAGVTAPADGTLTLDADGKAEFTLKHGQSIVLKGIHIGEQYEVVETEADLNGYVTTSTGEKNLSVTADQRAAFTNTRAMSPPTGITDGNHWPVMLLGTLLLLLTCIGMLWARRRRQG